MQSKQTVVVIGNGMVGQKLLDVLVEDGATDRWDVVAFGEERHLAYDRVNLSAYVAGASAAELNLAAPEVVGHPAVRMVVGDRVVAIDRDARTVTAESGQVVCYDALVLATGSTPFVPPVAGGDGPGCFVYRTLDDLDAIIAHAPDCGTGVVIGGGLLGLEAANALRQLGLETHVVEFAPRLMPVQVDDAGGSVLRSAIEAIGIGVHTAKVTTEVRRDGDRVTGLAFADGTDLVADLVVYSAGIRPRDDLARSCGLEVGERGGVVVDDACRTADPRVYAVGECASHQGRVYGLVAPGYSMARVVADRLTGGDATFTGADLSTKLKLLGVDVASFGDAHATTPGARILTWHDACPSDPSVATYKKLVVSGDGLRLLGGMLVGDASDYASLHQLHASGATLPAHPELLVLPSLAGASSPLPGAGAMDDGATVCTCNNVTKGAICAAITDCALTTVGEVRDATRAGSTCGSCTPLISGILDDELTRAGVAVDRSLCEHFPHTRQELFDIVRVRRVRTFAELVAGWGTGRGCAVCKPAVASMLATLWNEHVLDRDHASLQDTNDRFLANLQRDGTYSVVPRVPGGEITPERLIVLGEVARDYDLYTKVTGGQRIDLFGARLDQLPSIWRRLVDAGFESGHAYGKSLRTVKSCVGRSWCRYGVQDSTSLAIALEERYRGLRSPHKLKLAVSGCSRECAEAQGKDVGVIATEAGWNLYVGGNGGMKPQHAVLLATDLDTATLVRYIDRFLMFYVRTADRLERTATWLNKLDGGLEHLRRVVVDDSLGLAAELEAAMDHHVDTYRCEWAATLDDPAKLAMFTPFVNEPEAVEVDLAYVRERGQRRPASAEERAASEVAVTVTAGVGGR
ncbi:MAG TPA: nitrite reductase large subunit NirB [Acidimicrobiales bacterium]|nr:nitrite reductase large subunit NirB [Acidimicrobiales bacterium]